MINSKQDIGISYMKPVGNDRYLIKCCHCDEIGYMDMWFNPSGIRGICNHCQERSKLIER